MPVTVSGVGTRRPVVAAVGGSLVTALVVLAANWGRRLLLGRSPTALVDVVLGGALATVSFVPFLLAVVVVVADPSPRTVVGGAALVYVVDFLLAIAQAFLPPFAGGVTLGVLAVPLVRVVSFLALATGVWLAYHGGYDRLVAAAGTADHHPLFALVADERVGPGLSLQRGLVAAGLAATVGVGGLLMVGETSAFLRAVARAEPGGPTTVSFQRAGAAAVGLSLSRLPVQWVVEAAFLLAVVFVTGPRLAVRDLIKGVAVIVGAHLALVLLPALIRLLLPVGLRSVSRPNLAPLGDIAVLFGIAIAVWLASHGGLEALENRIRRRNGPGFRD